MNPEDHLYVISDEDISILRRILSSRYSINTTSISDSEDSFYKFYYDDLNSMSFASIKYLFLRFKLGTISKLLSNPTLDNNFTKKTFEFLNILIAKVSSKNPNLKFIISTFTPDIIGDNNYHISNYTNSSYKFYSLLNQYLYDLRIENENIGILPNISIYPIDDIKKYKHLVRTKSTLDINSSEKLACKLNQYLKNQKNLFPKLVILDLDNTLWGGILSEDSSILRIGGHDPIGEAYADLQLFFKNLKKEGVLLAIVSKNDVNNVKKFFKNNTYMPLKFDDFVTYRINWENKSQNIFSILEELNLSSKHVIFIDDNSHERDEVSSNLPEIKIPTFPEDIYARLLFFSNYIPEKSYLSSGEDELRTEMYKSRASRLKNMRSLINKNNDFNNDKYIEWLKTLNIELKIATIKNNLPTRLIQLFKRTNQFNLTGSHPDNNDLEMYLNQGYRISFCSVKDKFGDEGMVLAAVYMPNKTKLILKELVMSCRVFGRFLEYAFLKSIILNNYEKPGLININFNINKISTNKSSSDFVKNLIDQETKNDSKNVNANLLLKENTSFIKVFLVT